MTDIITITEADLARLQSWEFEEVWRPQRVSRRGQIASSCIRADQLAQAVKELRAHVERVASESDPIGAFRAKLRSS